MPKRLVEVDAPRRVRGRGALAVVPGFMMRVVMYSPKDFAAAFIAFAAICAIVANALFLQAGRHPSPMFGTPSFAMPAAAPITNPLPRPRPVEAAQAGDRPLDSRLFDNKPVDIARVAPKPDPRTEAKAEPVTIRIAPAQRPVTASNSNVPRPPANVPLRDPLGDLISRGSR